MSRPSDGARFAMFIGITVFCVVAVAVGLFLVFRHQLDAREHVRTANRLYKDSKFVDAAAMYEQALPNVDDPLVHFNLGLAYSKVFRPGMDKPIRLGLRGDFVCTTIPDVKPIEAMVCEDDPDRRYADCTERDAKDVCGKRACVKTALCGLDATTIATMAVTHLQKWVDVQPSDAEIRAELKKSYGELSRLETSRDDRIAKGDKAAINDRGPIEKMKAKIKELETKPTIRNMITRLFIDSDQHPKALAYWSELLKASPNDPEIMAMLAGINLKAHDWRTSIDWYLKVAEVTTEPSGKVNAYNYIGNVAWTKLNSKTLGAADSVEIADRGIAALQKALEIPVASKNSKLFGLQSSIFNQRALVQGPIWAASTDRASAQDLLGIVRVLNKEAKAAQEKAPSTPSTSNPSPPKPGATAEKTGG